MAKKERVDILLVEKGLIETREKAKRSIMAGLIYVNEERIDKPGMKIDTDSILTIKGDVLPYVSRGGLKLEKAINRFNLSLQDKIVLDIGASTGGFTDCSLQNGAKLVYALDVGYNQLAWKLRQDERVQVMERTNFRYVKPEDLQEGMPDFATIDVSFISLKLILPVLGTLLVNHGEVVALVKPQFEAGREEVGKKGIVRDPKTHTKVLTYMVEFALGQGYDVKGIDFSPIKGGEGNIEFLLYLSWEHGRESGNRLADMTEDEVVASAHQQLKDNNKADQNEG
ncbi:TlyA family RNA methyltransferase [Bacillus sp. FJAT-45350]|uniref:TlyA family RNA methyltransferase n=1 Tax=Bacillus sp. FJAT-45350 TaxID=2011014 RepID=UPI000BB6DFD5|nr:TlyA family RNA methyltransferase [Bacillus sp. FJAT-45350]